MSIESASAFMERMKTDEDFRDRITKAEDAEQRGEIVVAEGFDFTREEVESVANELSDEELNAVAGGSETGLTQIVLPPVTEVCVTRDDAGGTGGACPVLDLIVVR